MIIWNAIDERGCQSEHVFGHARVSQNSLAQVHCDHFHKPSHDVWYLLKLLDRTDHSITFAAAQRKAVKATRRSVCSAAAIASRRVPNRRCIRSLVAAQCWTNDIRRAREITVGQARPLPSSHASAASVLVAVAAVPKWTHTSAAVLSADCDWSACPPGAPHRWLRWHTMAVTERHPPSWSQSLRSDVTVPAGCRHSHAVTAVPRRTATTCERKKVQ